MQRTNIYVDANNLHRGAKALGFDIDYKKFRGWLSQKYSTDYIYLFIGLIPANIKLYDRLRDQGFILIFKETVSVRGIVKGNCDAEIILKVVSDFYTNMFDLCILITDDGDFGCLVDFLYKESVLRRIISPNRERSSFLLRNKNVPILFLNDDYHKFSRDREA